MKQLKTKFKRKINVKWSTIHSYHSYVRGVSTGYGLDGRCWIPGRGRMFFFSINVQTGSGVHSASYPMSAGTLSTEVKRLGREAET
jgi:hypothetical protein